ncbi:hypothetical protein CIPAW_02G063600 [Carya illinoinensis]|uniref:Uncharacterized protein n=1 Tax=Carya illinoinensis TaxID=32201 RepID=A0A8T1RDK6_CARIL|nr:hypothetical protein CIPAW_02G063600 [Carya illinoinensis]
MAANSQKPGFETISLFSSSDTGGLGFLDSPKTPLPPLHPCVEVLSSERSVQVKYPQSSVLSYVLLLFQGRVNTWTEVMEGSLDLVKALCLEVKNGNLSFCGKRVLELGCGHGLSGVFACLEGAAAVHFQDFIAEVIRFLTIPNVNADLLEKNQPSVANVTYFGGELRFLADDWSEIHKFLPHVQGNEKDLNHSPGHGQIAACNSQCTNRPHGVVYMAAKKYYFGVGGGTRRFLSGIMAASLVAEVADGSSNV